MLHTRLAAELRTTTGFLVCRFVRSYPKEKSAVWVHLIHSCYVTAWICKFAEHHTFTLTVPFISPNPACLCQVYSVGVGMQIQTLMIIWGGWQVNWNEEAELALWAYETVFLHSLKPLRSLLDLGGLLTSWTLDTCLQSADCEVQKLWERVYFTAVYLDCFKKCCIWLRYQHIHCGKTNTES